MNRCLLCDSKIASSENLFCPEHRQNFFQHVLSRQFRPLDANTSVAAATTYAGAARQWIQILKSQTLNPWTTANRKFIQTLIQHWSDQLQHTGVDVIVPVPASYKRHWLGWPLSELIAHELSLCLRVKVDRVLVPRFSLSALMDSQKTKTRALRLSGRNKHQRFKPRLGFFRPTSERRALLVDDIITTGSSFSEAGDCLRAMGYECRWAFALAETPLKQHLGRAFHEHPTL